MNNEIFLRQWVGLFDLTRLGDNDTYTDIKTLCEKAQTPYGKVASVFVYPQFVSYAKEQLKNTGILVGTVSNFPSGKNSLEQSLAEISMGLSQGAHEIDMVMPYHDFLLGRHKDVLHYLQTCREACHHVTFKVILETGALHHRHFIEEATQLVVESNADFVKTSTGKINIGATLEAADAILSVIKKFPKVGIKLSGGIKTISQIKEYLDLIEKKMPQFWISPQHVRFGTSKLFD